MRVLLDTDVIMGIYSGQYHNEINTTILKNLIRKEQLSAWVTAYSILQAERIIDSDAQKNNKEVFFEYINDNFTIIPLRNNIFKNAFSGNHNNFETRIQIAHAESVGIDFIITNENGKYSDLTLPVKTVEEFSAYVETQKNKVSRVPFLDLKAQQHRIFNEIDDQFSDIICNTAFILGKPVQEFETQFAAAHNAEYCIGVSSGTAALHIALMALGIGKNDKVIVPVNTFIATAEAVSMVGATPVFLDCDDYYNLDVQKLKTYLANCRNEGGVLPKAIIPVHLYGQPADISSIMSIANEYGIMVVEDSCQAHLAEWNGTKIGTFGNFSAFSFYPGKNLGAYGEAGAIITNDERLYDKAKKLRQHGETKRYHHDLIGHNFRMEAFQGAVLLAKMKHLDTWTEMRRKNAAIYTSELKNVDGIETPEELASAKSVYHLFVIQAENRDDLQAYLKNKGIDTGLHYPLPLHLQPAYRHLGYKEGDFPVAEKAAEKILSLPMYPELTEKQIMYVCRSIKEYIAQAK